MSIGSGVFGKKNPFSVKKRDKYFLIFFVNLDAQTLQLAD